MVTSEDTWRHRSRWVPCIGVALAMSLAFGGCSPSATDGESAPLLFAGPELVTHLPAIPFTVESADFNGDGKIDLLVTTVERKAYVLPGNGDGTFLAAKPIDALELYVSATVADLNRDGKPDLVVMGCRSAACPGAQTIVLLGKGDGTFEPVFESGIVTFPIGPYFPPAPAIGDFDGDGVVDLAYVDFVSGVAVLPGNGDGTFRSAIGSVVPGSLMHLVVTDLDRDGRQDLVAYDYGAGASILLGHGDGSFGPKSSPLCLYPGQLAVTDFNGDGKIDLMLSCSSGLLPGVEEFLRLQYRPGNGDGTFAQSLDPFDRNVLSFAADDLDRDGKPDLVVQDNDTRALSVMLGKGDGTFVTAQVRSLAAARALANQLVDLSGDGRPDLVLVADADIVVLVNTGTATTAGP